MGDGFGNKIARAMARVGLGEVFSQLVSPLNTGGAPPRRGTREFLVAYNDMPHLRAIVNKIGKAVSTTCWHLYISRDGQGVPVPPSRRLLNAPYETRQNLRQRMMRRAYTQTGGLTEVMDHPLLNMLEEGNSQLLGASALQTTQTHMELVGEAFWLLERNVLGTPVAYWPLPPDWVTALPTKANPYYVVQFGNVKEVVPATEIIRFVDPDPSNPYGRGSGISRCLADELETDEFAAKHLRNYFLNSARPEFIVVGQNLSPQDTQRLQERWEQRNKGFMNAFRAHFINRQVEIKTLTPSFESMQFTNIRKQERDIIQQTFGIPPEKLGILSASNRSTIAAADVFWRNDIIMPRLELLRAVLQKFLVPMYDERLILDFDLPQVMDEEFRLSVMAKAPWAHYVNEWRALSGHDDLGEKGDVLMVPLNMVGAKLDELGSLGQEPAAEEPEPQEPSDEDDSDNNNENEGDNEEDGQEETAVFPLDVNQITHEVMNRLKQQRKLARAKKKTVA